MDWRPSCRAFQLNPGTNKRKILAMAKDCAVNLRLYDWDVTPWDPEKITMDMLEILASSKVCNTRLGSKQLALKLARSADFSVCKYILSLEDKENRGINTVAAVTEHTVHQKVKVASIHPGKIADNQLRQVKASDYFEKICIAFANQEHHENIHDELQLKNLDADPLHTIQYSGTQISWTTASKIRYLFFWKSITKKLLNGQVNSSNDTRIEAVDISNLNIEVLKRAIDVLATARLASEFGIEVTICESFTYGKPLHRCMSLKVIKSLQLHFILRLKIAFLSHKYFLFLYDVLRSKRTVGPKTNFLVLRAKHNFSKCNQFENEVNNKTAWKSFTRGCKSSRIYDLREKHHKMLNNSCGDEEINELNIIRETLGGKIVRVHNIQASILDQFYDSYAVGRNTLLGRLNRRKVQLLICDQDQVLIIPYLNRVVLDLKDYRWIRDCDAKSMQPVVGRWDNGPIRRVANILLALEYNKTGEPTVNETARRILMQYARQGELYSSKLREHLMGISRVKERIDILQISTIAREIFGKRSDLASALIRELIHDRVLMKSDFGPERIIHDTGPTTQTYENDAYFVALYVQNEYNARNNVVWGSGVPIEGLKLQVEKSQQWEGMSNGARVVCRSVMLNGQLNKTIRIWFLKSMPEWNTRDLPSAWIEDQERGATSITLNNFCKCDSWRSRYFMDLRIGGFCKCEGITVHDLQNIQKIEVSNNFDATLKTRLISSKHIVGSVLRTAALIILYCTGVFIVLTSYGSRQ